MNPMRLLYHPLSTFSQRVRIALDEKGVACELVDVDMAKREHHGDEYRAKNPYARVPTLEDDGLVLYESTAILEYLEALHPTPALVPSTPRERGLMAMHVKLCDLEIGVHTLTFIKPARFAPRDKWRVDEMQRARDGVNAHLRVLEAQVGDGWLVGDAFTLADVCYAPFLRFLEELGLDAGPRVRAYAARLLLRPSVKRTWLAR